MRNPFRYFNSSPEVIRLAVMMYIRYSLSLRPVEDLLFERCIDISHEIVRFWLNRFGPMFAAEIMERSLQRGQALGAQFVEIYLQDLEDRETSEVIARLRDKFRQR